MFALYKLIMIGFTVFLAGCHPTPSSKSSSTANTDVGISEQSMSQIIPDSKRFFFHRGKHWFNDSFVTSGDWTFRAYTDAQLYCEAEMELCLLLSSPSQVLNPECPVRGKLIFSSVTDLGTKRIVEFTTFFSKLSSSENTWDSIIKQPLEIRDADGVLQFFPGLGEWLLDVELYKSDVHVSIHGMRIRRESLRPPAPPIKR